MADRVGDIELIFGPMFAEKSTEMLSRIRRAILANQPAVVVKSSIDTRYGQGNALVTHGGSYQTSAEATATSAAVRVVIATRLSEVELQDDEFVIGVDEGQFYCDLVEVVTQWAAQGRRVIVAALDGDFHRVAFPSVSALIPHCEFIEKRRGVCMVCRRRESAFTQCLVKCEGQVLVGGAEKYRSVCRGCYVPAAHL
jgi:thymidine kinase